jgi:glycosyltransferase involved in cell wall biosynthesis
MSFHVLFVGGEDLNLRIPFIAAMRDRGFRVTAAGSGPAAPFEKAGIEFVPFPFDRFISPLADIGALRRLAEIIRRSKPDLAQGFDTKPCVLLPIAARMVSNTKVIRTICGRGWIFSSRSGAALAMRLVYLMLHHLAARLTAATVFQIASDYAFFRRYRMVGRDGILIPAGGGGIDVEGFERAVAEGPSRERIRAELGLGDAETVITVTRLTRQKGLPALLRAAEIVHRQRPGVRFLIVGPRDSEGPLAVSREEIERHAPYVMAIGPRNDVPALLNAADVFAFPTEYAEGVPRVLLEAALAGLPIVATSMPGCCEVIEDGRSGILLPPGAVDLLAEGIFRVLDDRQAARAMASRCAARVRERFALTVMANRHAALYRALLSHEPITPPHLAVATGANDVTGSPPVGIGIRSGRTDLHRGLRKSGCEAATWSAVRSHIDC